MPIDPMAALLKTYRDAIRARLSLTGVVAERTVAISEDGRPHPSSGQKFYGLVLGSFSNRTQQGYIDAYLSMGIVITLRAPVVPVDKAGDELIVRDPDGLTSLAWELHEHLKTNRYSLMNAANVLLGGDADTRGFVEPFVLQSIRYLGVKGSDWFWAEDPDTAPSGVAIQIEYGQCRYVDSE